MVDHLTLPALPWHAVLVNVGPTFKLEERVDGRIYRTSGARGDVAVVPAGLSLSLSTRANEVQHVETVLMLVQPQRIVDLADTAGLSAESIGLRSVCGARLPRIAQIGTAVAHELQIHQVLSELYVESLASALAVHLLREQSGLSSSATSAEARSVVGLTRRELQRVSELVEANLERELTLADMAAVLHFSAFHFARLFKLATRISPHAYVMQRRTERARDLLEHTHLPLHEVAARTGFADQSHLARHIRRSFGFSPRDLRLGKQ
jgi:AraC family transcriptional regulator